MNFRRLLAASLLVTLPFALGCRDAVSPTGVASWQGGSLDFESLEAKARPRLERQAAGAGIERVVEHYRGIAREEALIALLRAEDGVVEDVIEAARPLFWTLETQATAQAFATSRLPRIQVTEAEIEKEYAENPEKYTTPGRRSVLHIFKRHRQGVDALEALAELRARVLAGERFEDLMDASESEVRLLDGGLGWIGRGALPPALEEVVFALGIGELSQPVSVKGGGILFLVKDAEIKGQLALAQVRSRIRDRLIEEKRARSIADYTANLEIEHSLIADDEVASRLATVGPEDVLISAPDFELTASDFRLILAEGFEASGQPQDPVEVYRQLARQTLLSLKAQAEGFPETAEETARFERLVATSRDTVIDRKLLEIAIRRRVEGGETLPEFFEQQKNRYRSPLALRLQMLRIADTRGAAEKMVRLEELHRSSRSGSEPTDLTSAAKELGGEVIDLGWLDFAALDSLPKKVRVYLFDIENLGLTIPFQQDGSLNMIEIMERREPQPLSFHQAKGAVLRDYLERHGQSIYKEMLEERLDAAGFRFDEEAVRSRLDVTPAS